MIDRGIASALESVVVKTFRYVDDYMVFVEDCRCVNTRVDVLKVFKEMGYGAEVYLRGSQQWVYTVLRSMFNVWWKSRMLDA